MWVAATEPISIIHAIIIAPIAADVKRYSHIDANYFTYHIVVPGRQDNRE